MPKIHTASRQTEDSPASEPLEHYPGTQNAQSAPAVDEVPRELLRKARRVFLWELISLIAAAALLDEYAPDLDPDLGGAAGYCALMSVFIFLAKRRCLRKYRKTETLAADIRKYGTLLTVCTVVCALVIMFLPYGVPRVIVLLVNIVLFFVARPLIFSRSRR